MPSPIPDLGRTLRNIKRAQEIVAVFAEYGFNDVIHELSIDRMLFKGKRFLGLTGRDAELVRKPQAERLRLAMEKLGPTFIKMAQVLATRRDLIPEEWADEFAKLQDDVPAVPAAEIEEHIRTLYDGDLSDRFTSIDYTAFAAASMAQAHIAVLTDGREVVLKILRPGSRELLDSDIEILRTLAEFMESHFEGFGYSPTQVIDQFERQIKRELDLPLEARAIERLRTAFEDSDRVGFPVVYREHTRDGVLCLERVKGTPLSKAKPGAMTDEQREAIVAAGADAVFRQCFELGFFHADPHPGNLFVVEDDASPAGVRLVFIDLGMTGHVDPRTRDLLGDLVHGTIQGELDRVVSAVIELTDAPPMLSSERAFRADVWEFISRFQSGTLDDLQMGALLEEFFSKVRRHRLECPADIVHLIKAITTIEGVGEMFCPTFDIIGHVSPHVERLVKQRYGFKAVRRRIENASLGYAEMAEQLPRDARDILRMIRRDKIVIKLEHKGVDRLTSELEQASQNISHALVVASLILCGAILFLADAAAGEGWGVLTVAGGASLLLAASMVAIRFVRLRLP